MEWTIESHKTYTDPFNDVDVDVVFTRNGESWRVPTFWRGGQRWTVRFAPPVSGDYNFYIESTDVNNPDLNGHKGHVHISPYTGTSTLLRRGKIKVSGNGRYFEHADGTPFYWLGDTWWMGLSGRLSWNDFQQLTSDRRAKGFTVIQTVAGLVPREEECPMDPGCGNEGGQVWEPGFKRINPRYFDYADRRIELLVNSGMAPAIVGAWENTLDQIGVEKLKKHWRYIIARYGVYPVFWVVGGEIFDPPEDVARKSVGVIIESYRNPGAWTEIARYIRATDPYHHPLTAHEMSPDDPPLQADAALDFRMFQPSHFGWPSIAVEVAELNVNYARLDVTKPLVVGEIGYEALGGTHLQDFQRVAFWLAMLNGAAGYTYGAAGTFEAYTTDKPRHRVMWSFLTWDEGMRLPGSYQIGLGAKLLRQYPWWNMSPHPEWVTPRGTTLLEPRRGRDRNHFHIDLAGEFGDLSWAGLHPPTGEWSRRKGDFRLPYAAGIPRQVRFIYLPYFGLIPPEPPTILGLELDCPYHAYYWEPSLGIKIDLGLVERPTPGATLLFEDFASHQPATWTTPAGAFLQEHGPSDQRFAIAPHLTKNNVVVEADVDQGADVGLVLRYQNATNYVVAVYSPANKTIYIREYNAKGRGPLLGTTGVPLQTASLHLSAEVRGTTAIVSLTDGKHTVSSPIVNLSGESAGAVGLACACASTTHHVKNFRARESPLLPANFHLQRRLYDASGKYRGELAGPGGPGYTVTELWDDYGKDRHILLDAYRPDLLPTSGDWLLVLENQSSQTH